MISQLRLNVPGAVLMVLASLVLTACSTTPQQSGHSGSVSRTHEIHRPLSVGDSAAAAALQQLGRPYRYGGRTPAGFDCSGLVQYSYLQAGKALPRTTGQLWKATKPISQAAMQPGDLVFFSIKGKMQHVGLYLGDGRFIHAPQSGRSVSIASLDDGYYEQAFLRAGRPR